MRFIVESFAKDGTVEHATACGVAGDKFEIEFKDAKIVVLTVPETEEEHVILARRAQEALRVAENYIQKKYPDDYQPLYFPR